MARQGDMHPAAVIHIPHAARLIPHDVRRDLLLNDTSLEVELGRLTDHDTDVLFSVPSSEAAPVIYPVSRLVVDPERFVDDAAEVMTSRGMGVVYTRTSDQAPLRGGVTPGQRNALLERFYYPHHQRLTATVAAAVDTYGRCLIVDAHSFPSAPLPYELDKESKRQDICIGTDGFHTPRWLCQLAVKIFKDLGLTVAIDRPFSGTIVPAAFFGCDLRVLSIMVEVNRGVYMDEVSGCRSPAFGSVAAEIRTAIVELIQRSVE